MEPLTSPTEDIILSLEVQVNLLAKRGQLVGHPEYLELVLRALGLFEVQAYMERLNPSSRAPYHGFIHESAVVVAVFEAAFFHDLSFADTRNLVIAASFHDYNHWGDLDRTEITHDSANIAAALTGLRNFCSKHQELNIDLLTVEPLIKSTEFPHKTPPRDLLEAILRDADYSMPMLSDELALELFKGLYKELKANLNPMSYADFTAAVIPFYEAAPPHTSWGSSSRLKWHFNDRVNRIATLLQENP